MPTPTTPLWGQIISNGINNIRNVLRIAKERYNSMSHEQKAEAARVGDQWVRDNVLPTVTTLGEILPQTSIPMAAYAASEAKTPEEKFQHIMMPVMMGSVGKATGTILRSSENGINAIRKTLNAKKSSTPIPKSIKRFSYAKGIQTPLDMTARYYDGKKWNLDAIIKDFKEGKKSAVDYLTSEIKANTDKHNIELAKKLGWEIAPETNPGKAAIPMLRRTNEWEEDPRFVWIGQNDNGFYLLVNGLIDSDAAVGIVDDFPQYDRMAIQYNRDIGDRSFHEHLHRGDLGRKPHRTVNTKEQAVKSENTQKFYNWKTEQLLLPSIGDETDAYLREMGEAPVNFMEIGRRAGINPGEAFPENQNAIQKIENIIANDEVAGEYLLKTKYKTKPQRVWSAMNGTYYSVPLMITSIFNTNDE